MATQKRKTCKHCKKKFTPARSDQIFCSAICQKQSSRQEADKNTLLLKQLSNTGFFNYLQFQSRRAGTVEVVPKKLEELTELHSLWSYNNKANAYRKEREYELSHILPVRGITGKIGTLHPSNLVVQPSSFNRSHSNKYLGNGHSINSYRMKPEFEVDEYATKAEILEKVFKRIGVPTLRLFKKEAKPSTLAVIKELEWFEKKVCLLDKSIDLNKLDLEQLRELKSGLTGVNTWCADWRPYDRYTVLLHELQRQSVYRPELSQVLVWLSENIKVDPNDFWLYVQPDEVGNMAFYHESISHLQFVLVGATLNLDALNDACQTVYKAAYDEQVHKDKIAAHIQALVSYGVIEHRSDSVEEGVPFTSGKYVFSHTGKPFDKADALNTPLPEHPWDSHADYPDMTPWDLSCSLPIEAVGGSYIHDPDECPF